MPPRPSHTSTGTATHAGIQTHRAECCRDAQPCVTAGRIGSLVGPNNNLKQQVAAHVEHAARSTARGNSCAAPQRGAAGWGCARLLVAHHLLLRRTVGVLLRGPHVLHLHRCILGRVPWLRRCVRLAVRCRLVARVVCVAWMRLWRVLTCSFREEKVVGGSTQSHCSTPPQPSSGVHTQQQLPVTHLHSPGALAGRKAVADSPSVAHRRSRVVEPRRSPAGAGAPRLGRVQAAHGPCGAWDSQEGEVRPLPADFLDQIGRLLRLGCGCVGCVW